MAGAGNRSHWDNKNNSYGSDGSATEPQRSYLKKLLDVRSREAFAFNGTSRAADDMVLSSVFGRRAYGTFKLYATDAQYERSHSIAQRARKLALQFATQVNVGQLSKSGASKLIDELNADGGVFAIVARSGRLKLPAVNRE